MEGRVFARSISRKFQEVMSLTCTHGNKRQKNEVSDRMRGVFSSCTRVIAITRNSKRNKKQKNPYDTFQKLKQSKNNLVARRVL